jgi:integrase
LFQERFRENWRMENHWIENWLSQSCGSKLTERSYRLHINRFSDYCKSQGKNLSSIVDDYRTARYSGAREEQMFLDQWNDLIRSYSTKLKPTYAIMAYKAVLSALKSFLKYCKIPVDVELPKRACVTYHNQDLEKEQIRMILSKATERDKVIFLWEAESGLRAGSILRIKYWQIKKDFEAGSIPMQIKIPSSDLKDRVGDHFCFVGEDGFNYLKDYFKPRHSLKDNDYVFPAEKPGLVAGEQVTVSDLSIKFNRIVNKLNMERGAPPGKPGHYRMHGLRKYFFNNMKAPIEYRDFWMGHTLGVNDHYMNRNPEEHRKIYAQGYEHLRIFQEPATPAQLIEITDNLKQKDQELQELKTQNQQLSNEMKEIREQLASGLLSDNCIGGLLDEIKTSMKEEIMKELKMKKKREDE